MESPKYNRTIIRVRHQSIPAYLAATRSKASEFGKEALTPYEEPRSLVLGFQCGDEVHIVGLNNIRAHYNIRRTLPDIPGLVILNRNPAPYVSEEEGIAMFTKDCRDALNSNHH
jgi:hypothetical protein